MLDSLEAIGHSESLFQAVVKVGAITQVATTTKHLSSICQGISATSASAHAMGEQVQGICNRRVMKTCA